MHNIKEAIYENKSKLEGIGEDYQIQVSVMCSLSLKAASGLFFFYSACDVKYIL